MQELFSFQVNELWILCQNLDLHQMFMLQKK